MLPSFRVVTGRRSEMLNRKSVLTACGAILGLAITASATGWVTSNVSRTNHLTFSGPVALPGVTLPAGTYVFELASPQTSPDIVCVRNAEWTMADLRAFTERIDRWFPIDESTA